MIFRVRVYNNKSQDETKLKEGDNLRYLFFLVIASIFFGTSAGINIFNFSIYLSEYNLGPASISHILGFDLRGNILIAPFVLLLTTRLGVFNLIILSLFVRNIALALFALSSSEFEWKTSLLLFGMGGFCLYVALFQWINNLAKNEHRATYLSFASVAFGFGISLGPIITIFYGVELENDAFIISILISTLMIFPIYLARKSKPKQIKQTKILVSKIIKFAYLPLICAFASEYVFYTIAEFLPLYSLKLGMEKNQAYMLSAFFTFSGLIFGIPLGMIIDRVNRSKIIILFALAISISAQLIPVVINNILLTGIVFIILSSSINGIIIGGLAILGDRFKGDDFVAANSTLHALSTIGGFAGITITGNAMEKLGNKGFIFSISSLFLVFLALIIFEAYKYKKY